MDTNPHVLALKCAREFFQLAAYAANHGGFWVSAGGGTARVVAGEIARATKISFEAADHALECAGREAMGRDWYLVLRYTGDAELRWNARTIARAAIRKIARGRR